MLSKLHKVWLGLTLLFCVTGIFFWDAGFQFYLTKGMSVEAVVRRFGKPLETHDNEKAHQLSLIYYSPGLNVVRLEVVEGRVVDIDIRIAD